MFDITLYGHLVVDTIHDAEKSTMDFGGMANMSRMFAKLDSNLNLGLVPTAFGYASIFIDRVTSTRSSKATLNKIPLDIDIKQSKISHVLYINELDNTSFVKDVTGIVTADCCKGKPVDTNLVKYIDYLFISDDELENLDEIRKSIKGAIIIHSPTGSTYIKGNIEQTYTIDSQLMIENANVLGAGDMFASCFLLGLHNSMDDATAIDFAHRTTSKILKELNEKI